MAFTGGIPEAVAPRDFRTLADRVQEIAEIEIALNQISRSLLWHKALYLDTNPVNVGTTEGTISWNPTEHCLNVQSDRTDVIFQVPQENVIPVKCGEVGGITNGQVCYILDSDGNNAIAKLADADTEALSKTTMGLATCSMTHNQFGYVTTFGRVRDINTTHLTEGALVYLSSTAGGTTATLPVAPAHSVVIGVCLIKNANNGTILVNVQNGYELDELHDVKITSVANGDLLSYDSSGPYWKNNSVFNDVRDPTGFIDNNNIGVSYDSVNRTITLTHASGFITYYWRGQRKQLVSPWVSTAHAATTDTRYFLYSADGTTFSWSTTIWDFSDCMVAIAYYGATNKFALRETHGTMGWATHEEFHRTTGTYRESGGTLSGYTLLSTTAAQRRPAVSVTYVHDEDNSATISALPTGTYTQIYLTGTGTVIFATAQAEIVPVLANNPYYNLFSTPNWTQVLVPTNGYSSVWLIAVPTTDDAGSLVYRYLWMQGQSQGTLAAQQALTSSSLNLGDLASTFAEFVFIGQIIIRYTGGNWVLQQVVTLTGTRTNTTGVSGSFLSAVTTDTTLTGAGTPANPLHVDTLTDLRTAQTATVSALEPTWTGPIATHKVPIVLNGATYYIILTT